MEEARKSQKDWQRKDEGARKAKKKTKDLYKALLKDKRDKLFGAAQISLAGEIDEIKTVLTDIMDAPGGHELAKELISTEISNLKARLVAFCDEYCEDFSTRLSFNEDNQDSDLDGAEDSNISRDDNKNSEADDDNADNSEVDNGHDSGHNGGDDSEDEQEVFSRSQVHRASRRRRRSAKYSGGVFTLDLPAPGDESDKNTNYVTEEESEIEEIHDDKNPDSSSDDSIPARLPKSTTKAQTVPRSSGQKRASHAAASDRKTKRPRTSDGGSKEPIETDKGTISWNEIENQDFVFSSHGAHYIIRCESAPGVNVLRFLKHPFTDWDVLRHLSDLSEEAVECHSANAVRKYTKNEAIKKLGYKVILPYPTDTDEGQRKNRKWVADNNKVAKKLGTEVEENGDEQSGDEERESVSRE